MRKTITPFSLPASAPVRLNLSRALVCALAASGCGALSLAAHAADVTITPSTGSNFAVKSPSDGSDHWRVQADGGLLATDAAVNAALAANSTVPGPGTIPATGAGARMMWYPAKAAFRAGYVDGLQWDDANVGLYSTATGKSSTASGVGSTAMGYNTTASGVGSTAMGFITTASGIGSTAMGYNTTASGDFSTAMGDSTTASGIDSTAMGYNASTNGHKFSFIYGDGASISNTADNQFMVRASGGLEFLGQVHVVGGTGGVANRLQIGSVGSSGYGGNDIAFGNGTQVSGIAQLGSTAQWQSSTSITMVPNNGGGGGCTLSSPAASGWSCSSDRNLKTKITPVDARALLAKLVAMQVASWAFKAAPEYTHIGPMAQDFKKAFDLGDADDKHISTMDGQGVLFAAVQGLYALLVESNDKSAKSMAAFDAKQTAANGELRAALAQRDRDIANLRSEKDAQIAAHEKQIADLQRELGEARTQVASLSALPAEVDALKARMGRVESAAPVLTAARP